MILQRTNDVGRDFKERMVWWHGKAMSFKNSKNYKDPWISFVLYWIIFDAYLTEISGLGGDDKKLDYFFENENDFKKILQPNWTSLLSSHINALKNLSPVKDMRPGSTQNVYLNNPKNIEEVFRFVYQIRCNLFHGSTDIKNSKDADRVFHAEKFLRGAIDWWMTSGI